MTFTAGIAFGWSSPVTAQLTTDSPDNPIGRPITVSESSWIAGLICIGAIFGPIIAGPLARKIGRKRTLLLAALPILIGFVICAFAKLVYLLYFARLLKGFGVGSIFAVLPMYVGEIATDSNRGALGCSMTVFTTAGFLFSYSVGPFFSVQNFCFICTIPIIVFLVSFSLWNPESPQFLASIGDQQSLELSLLKLRRTSLAEIKDEISLIYETLQLLGQNRPTFRSLFVQKNLRRGLIVSIGLITLQQLAGINPILSYTETIFSQSKSSIDPAISAIIVGLVQFITTIIASLLVESLGRRALLLISTQGCGLALTILGLYFLLQKYNYNVGSFGWVPVAGLIIYMISVSIGLQPLLWAIMGEIFPHNVKSIASILTSASCFLTATLTTITFPFFEKYLGMGLTFGGYSVACGFGMIFIYFMVPETKGKNVQEIQGLLEK